MQVNLMVKASEAISRLWMFQLERISEVTGVDLLVLCECVDVSGVGRMGMVVSEKAKDVVSNKKETESKKELVDSMGVVVEGVEVVVEKKKRAPAKKKEKESKKEVVVSDSVDITGVVLDASMVEVNKDDGGKAKGDKKKGDKKGAKGERNGDKKGDKKKVNGDNVRINVERVEIDGTCFLVGEDDVAFLESSKQMVGKYECDKNTIRLLSDKEYSDLYGVSNEEDVLDEDEDECPALSDVSDSE